MAKAEIRRRVGETLEIAGLSGFGGRKPRELSGGQQQRVALCRALVYRPPVILMDEPLGALDKKLRDQLQVEIKSIQQELGLTVIYVTHDQEEALVMSDRIAVMRNGLIEQFDTPRELFERPQDPVRRGLPRRGQLPARPHRAAHRRAHPGPPRHSGGLLKARRHQLPSGTEVKVAVQPGRLRACATDDGFCTGTVETATYVGTLVRAGRAHRRR